MRTSRHGEPLAKIDMPWFLLFEVHSMDGAGPGTYIGRTTDPQIAKQWHDQCKEPWTHGYVVICTDDTYRIATTF